MLFRSRPVPIAPASTRTHARTCHARVPGAARVAASPGKPLTPTRTDRAGKRGAKLPRVRREHQNRPAGPKHAPGYNGSQVCGQADRAAGANCGCDRMSAVQFTAIKSCFFKLLNQKTIAIDCGPTLGALSSSPAIENGARHGDRAGHAGADQVRQRRHGAAAAAASRSLAAASGLLPRRKPLAAAASRSRASELPAPAAAARPRLTATQNQIAADALARSCGDLLCVLRAGDVSGGGIRNSAVDGCAHGRERGARA